MMMYVIYLMMYDVLDMLDALNDVKMNMLCLHDIHLNMLMFPC